MILALLIIGHFVIGVSGYLLTRHSHWRDGIDWTNLKRWAFLTLAILPLVNISVLLVGVILYISGIESKESKW